MAPWYAHLWVGEVVGDRGQGQRADIGPSLRKIRNKIVSEASTPLPDKADQAQACNGRWLPPAL